MISPLHIITVDPTIITLDLAFYAQTVIQKNNLQVKQELGSLCCFSLSQKGTTRTPAGSTFLQKGQICLTEDMWTLPNPCSKKSFENQLDLLCFLYPNQFLQAMSTPSDPRTLIQVGKPVCPEVPQPPCAVVSMGWRRAVGCSRQVPCQQDKGIRV